MNNREVVKLILDLMSALESEYAVEGDYMDPLTWGSSDSMYDLHMRAYKAVAKLNGER